MSERRKPLVTLHLREHADDFRVKIEVFDGSLWPEQRLFRVMHASHLPAMPIPTAPRARRALGPLYRLRMNGAWYPGQAKVLVTRKFIDQTLNDLLEEALYVPYDRKP